MFDANDWTTDPNEVPIPDYEGKDSVKVSPTEENNQRVIDVNNPEVTTEIVKKGLNLTNTFLGYHDGSAWKSYISSTGTFKFNGDNNNYIEWDGSALSINGKFKNQTDNNIFLVGYKIDTQVSKNIYTVVSSPTINIYVWTGTKWELNESFGDPTLTEGDYDTSHIIKSNVDRGLSVFLPKTNYTNWSYTSPPDKVALLGVLPDDGTGDLSNSSAGYFENRLGGIGLEVRQSTTSTSNVGTGLDVFGLRYGAKVASSGTALEISAGANQCHLRLNPTISMGTFSLSSLPTNDGGTYTGQTPELGWWTGFLFGDAEGKFWIHDDTSWNLNTTLVPTPTSSTSTGKEGQIAKDNDYLYICISTNTWKRIPLSTW